ncbi:hypothetical protein D3C77_738970 [compost metagenome]
MLDIGRSPELEHLIHFIDYNSTHRMQLKLAQGQHFTDSPRRAYDKLRMLP